MTDDVEICMREILECNDNADGQGYLQSDNATSDEDETCPKQLRPKPYYPSQSEKDEQDAQMRQFFTMKCDLCPTDVKFEKLTQAKKHYRQVHSVKGYLMCCGRKFAVRSWIMDHIRFHVNPNAYQCAHCEKGFSSKRVLQEHVKRHFGHGHKCSICSKNFSSASGLRRHVEVKHSAKTGNRLLRCHTCSKTFRNVTALNSHIYGVHLTQPAVCEICARLFKSENSLQRHVAMTHPSTTQPRVICDICGASCKHETALKEHLKRHENAISKVDPIKCPICDKTVKHRKALTQHLYFTHPERLHQCTMCPKSFKRVKNLKEHIAVHTGEDLYRCPYCDKKGKSNANMNVHVKKAHFDDWARDNPERVIKKF